MAEFPVDPMLAKMIIQSQKYGVSGEPACLTQVGRAVWLMVGQACCWPKWSSRARSTGGVSGELNRLFASSCCICVATPHPALLSCAACPMCRDAAAQASLPTAHTRCGCSPVAAPAKGGAAAQDSLPTAHTRCRRFHSLPPQRRWPPLQPWCPLAGLCSTGPRTRRCMRTMHTRPSTAATLVSLPWV